MQLLRFDSIAAQTFFADETFRKLANAKRRRSAREQTEEKWPRPRRLCGQLSTKLELALHTHASTTERTTYRF
jgi:hypothetical protein